MKWLRTWLPSAKRRPVARKNRIQLTLTRLESRDNPSVPSLLLNVPALVPILGPGYSETHLHTESFSHTATLDETGSGDAGTYTLDVVGETLSRDTATGSGGDITSASGALTTDVTYHLIIHGVHTQSGDEVVDESYTQTGSATESHSVTYDPQSQGGNTVQYDGDYTLTWSLSWSGVVSDGALSFTSLSYVRSEQTDYHMHIENGNGGFTDQRISTGSDINETGSGTEATYTGQSWWEEHDHTHSPGLSGGPDGPPSGPPNDSYYDNSWSLLVSGTGQLGTTPLEYDIPWKAEESTAASFAFHGVTVDAGTLTENATYTEGRLDINSFATTSHSSDLSDVIEDEPAIPDSGTGSENYHKDEIYAYTNDTTGSGSYVNAVYSADFHVDQVASDSAHNILTVEGDHTVGTTDEGEPYDLTFNYRSDQTTNATYTISFDYHDSNDRSSVLSSAYSFQEGSLTNVRHWGTRNGTGFDESTTNVESGNNSFTITGDNVPINSSLLPEAYPFTNGGQGQFLASYGTLIAPLPPLPPDIWYVQNVPNPVFIYNAKIKAIGNKALQKTAKTAGNLWVMLEMENKWTLGQKPNMADTFTFVGKGKTFGIAVGKDSEVGKAMAAAVKAATAQGFSNVTTTEDAQITYFVEPAPAGALGRSGKCVCLYKIIVNVTGTKNGVQRTTAWTPVEGDFWFIDDNLKTKDLTDNYGP